MFHITVFPGHCPETDKSLEATGYQRLPSNTLLVTNGNHMHPISSSPGCEHPVKKPMTAQAMRADARL